MAIAALKNKDLEQELAEAMRLPYSVSRFLNSQESEEHQFEEYFHETEGQLIMRFQPGNNAEGPPGHCHGGFIATMLDECMGGVAWWNTYVVLAGNLNIRYRKPVPLHETYYVRGEVLRAEKRRVYCRSELLTRDGTVMAQGTGMFVRLPWEKFPEDKNGNFAITRKFIEMRAAGIGFRECVQSLQAERMKLTPPA